MLAQIYLDDSSSQEGYHVLAGYIARAESWAKFTKEWEQLLPLTNRSNSGRHRFKMSEMAQRMHDVPAFYKVISDNVAFSMALITKTSDVENAKARLWSDRDEIQWRSQDDAKNVLLRLFLDLFFQQCWDDKQLHEWLSPGDKIDIYFDNDAGSSNITNAWYDNLHLRPDHIAEFVGERPRFGDGEEFLPLQAADFFAWWVREGYETGNISKILNGDFGTWRGERKWGFRLFADEDMLAPMFIQLMKSTSVIPGLVTIYDSKYKPKDQTAMACVTLGSISIS